MVNGLEKKFDLTTNYKTKSGQKKMKTTDEHKLNHTYAGFKICVYLCLSVVKKQLKPLMNADKHRLNHIGTEFLEKVYQ